MKFWITRDKQEGSQVKFWIPSMEPSKNNGDVWSFPQGCEYALGHAQFAALFGWMPDLNTKQLTNLTWRQVEPNADVRVINIKFGPWNSEVSVAGFGLIMTLCPQYSVKIFGKQEGEVSIEAEMTPTK
jgi:hypothetical protein